jgi:hypothetical protein
VRVSILAKEHTVIADSDAEPVLTSNVFGVRIVAGHVAVFFTTSEWERVFAAQWRRDHELA